MNGATRTRPFEVDQASDRAYYLSLEAKPEGSGKEEQGLPLAWPSESQLRKHLRLMPKTKAVEGPALFKLQAFHKAAVSDISELGVSKDDERSHVLLLRSEGLDVDEIAETAGISKRVYELLASDA